MNWIKSYYTFISVLKDSLIIFIIYNNVFKKIFNIYPNLLTVTFLIISWILLNYILGQYEINYKNLKNKLLSNLVNTLLVTITSNIIYITIKLITGEMIFDVSNFHLFINKTSSSEFLKKMLLSLIMKFQCLKFLLAKSQFKYLVILSK